MTGTTVPLSASPKKIFSMCASATDAAARLGARRLLAGVDEHGLIVDGAQNLPVLAKGGIPNRELLMAAGVDLAFVWWYQGPAADALRSMGVPVVTLKIADARDAPRMLRLVGDCVGRVKEATAMAEELERSIDQLMASESADAARRPKVYFELYSPFKTAGRNSYVSDLIRMAGGGNAAEGLAESGLITPESLMASDPDVIVFIEGFATAESFAARPGMSSIRAVKEGRIFGVDRRLIMSGAGVVESAETLRRIIHQHPARK